MYKNRMPTYLYIYFFISWPQYKNPFPISTWVKWGLLSYVNTKHIPSSASKLKPNNYAKSSHQSSHKLRDERYEKGKLGLCACHKTKSKLRYHIQDTIHSLNLRYFTFQSVKAISLHAGPPVKCTFLFLHDSFAWVNMIMQWLISILDMCNAGELKYILYSGSWLQGTG